MFEAIRHNLTGLARFSGRDSRSTFWFYVLFLFLIYVALSMLGGMVVAGGMIGGAFEAARSGMSEAQIQQQMLQRMASTMRMSAWLGMVLSLGMTAMVAAAFTRRLHDSGKPGWIALVILGLQLAATAYNIGMIDETVSLVSKAQSGDIATMQAVQAKIAARSLLGWVAPILFVIFGVMSSSDGDNRYGPEPDHL